MRSALVRLVIGAAVVGLILVPAVLWSGKRAVDSATREAAVKLPEFSTVSPELTPYVLTPLEWEKLDLPAFSSPIPPEYLRQAEPGVVVGGKGPYPGMTEAELEKVAAWRDRMQEGTDDGTQEASPASKAPISTIENVPRAPGIEGMTPAERAKLEAYAKEGGQK